MKNNKIRKAILFTLGVFLFLPLIVFAKPEISVSVKAEKEVIVIEEDKEVLKRVITENIDPDQVIFFTVNYKNSGDEKAINIKLNNPIPDSTQYSANSAWGKNSTIELSVDGGKTYQAEKMLKKQVAAGKVTHVRWLVSEIKANTSSEAGFEVITK